MSKYQDRKYEVLAYDPAWPATFNVEAEKLKDVFRDDALSIEHIGSTSIPGMAGKATIDILVLVADVAVAEEHRSDMEALGYEYAGAYIKPDARLFRKMQNGAVLANVHLFPPNHPHVREMLRLRDYLRSNVEEVAAYSDLKKELYQKYPNDYGEYRKQKDAYMAGLVKRVEESR